MNNVQSTTIAQSYDDYYRIGLYTSRYPKANIRVLNTLFQHAQFLAQDSLALDYGCGNGRYSYPILKQTNLHLYGFDISEIAVQQAKQATQPFSERVDWFSDQSQLHQHVEDRDEKFQLGMLLFGVMSHIREQKDRANLLKWFYKHMKPDGSLILSVPNRRRRFLTLQWRQRNQQNLPGDIQYQRFQSGRKIPLFYHLYTVNEIRAELIEAGFDIEKVTAESIFPERFVIQNSAMAFLDNLLCNLLPASLGYGLLVVARRRA
ncbi:class I SAM-dependent methyltransferase [Vibrio coralliilyticus]|uniref:class I SAM-dependent methyltransferase n=1 Tax=Vibrio coralliilyticus TaxID=190893 RepID=UPI00155F6FE4|nr:class I SAM-dependent methyltransferase [Vibrio coralliilyticus]NRF13663.1 class I SAM-dependent methyltransferase [Vibrio coralliilyticus]